MDGCKHGSPCPQSDADIVLRALEHQFDMETFTSDVETSEQIPEKGRCADQDQLPSVT